MVQTRVHTELVAPNLATLAVTSHYFRGPFLKQAVRRGRKVIRTRRWTRTLDHAVTSACLVDLSLDGRLIRTDRYGLEVVDASPTGSAAHDLVLTAIAPENGAFGLRPWVRRLARQCGWALIADEVARGVTPYEAMAFGLVPKIRYDFGDADHLARLRDELQRVYDGNSADPLATALVLFCCAAELPQLLPNRPSLSALRKRVRQIPGQAVVAALGTVVVTLTDHAALDSMVTPVVIDIPTFDGGFGDFGGGGDGG